MTHISTSTRIRNDPSPACRAIGWRLGRRRMNRSKIAEPQFALAGIAIFSALPPNSLKAVHRRCSWRRYEQGEPIVGYLDASDDVFFVTAGEVCVTIYSLAGKVVSFRNLGAGETFGEYAAIDGEPRSASVEARTSCLIASMPAKEFRKLLKTEPVVAQAVIRALVRNVRTLTKRVYEFSTLAVNNRIQAELLRLASLATARRQGRAPRPGADACRDCKPRQHPSRGGDPRAQPPFADRPHRAPTWNAYRPGPGSVGCNASRNDRRIGKYLTLRLSPRS